MSRGFLVVFTLLLATCSPQTASLPPNCNAVIVYTTDQPHARVLMLDDGGPAIIYANRNVPQSEIDHECAHVAGMRHTKSAMPSYVSPFGERESRQRETINYRGNGPTHGPFTWPPHAAWQERQNAE